MRFPITFGILLLIVASCVVWRFICTRTPDILNIGTFLVLTLTLVSLVFYAYDTNSIARITRAQWKRKSVLNTMYEMATVDQRGQAGRTVFQIHNPSTLVVRAKVDCNFRLYGDRVDYHADFDGTATWYVYPQQVSQGWFEIAPLLEKKGKTVSQLIAEWTAENWTSQLTMDLMLQYRDELEEHRELPSRKCFFDFDEWRWVPVLTTTDDWVWKRAS